MSRLSTGFGLLLAAITLFAGAGCDPQGGTQPEPDPRLNSRLDEIQAQLLAVQEQISTLNTPAPATKGPLTLKPVVPVEPAPAPATVKTRITRLAQQPRVATRSTSKSKAAKYQASAKKYIRVGVSAATVQRALKNAGFNPGKIDGKVGERTLAAIRMFQRKEGLKVDGIVGRATWARLQPHATGGGAASFK